MAETFVSSREMVEDIWRRVARDRDTRTGSHIRPLSHLASLNHDLERHFINRHWELEHRPTDIATTEPLAGLKAKVKRRAALFTVAVLERYFSNEEVFIAHLVRFQNNVADAHDSLAREVTNLHSGVRLEFERMSTRIASLEEAVQSQRPA